MKLSSLRSVPGFAMAAQAVCAVIAIEILSSCFKLERIYWAEIGALMVICQSFGESVRKSLRRAFSTLIGAIFGALACHLSATFGLPVWGHFLLIAFAAFMGLRCYPERYQAYVFWLCFGVVLLLDVPDHRGDVMAFVRIYEASLGSVCGVLASFLILPTRSRERAAKEFSKCLEDMPALLEMARAPFAGKALSAGVGEALKAFNVRTSALDSLLASVEAEEAMTVFDDGALAGRLLALRVFRLQLSDLFERLPFALPEPELSAELSKWASLILDDLDSGLLSLARPSDGKVAPYDMASDKLRLSFRSEIISLLERHPDLKNGSAQAFSAIYWLLVLRASLFELRAAMRS